MKPYNEKSDVFSFGVLMWEVLSLKAPFSDIKSRRDLREKVYEKGQRPSLPRRKWPRQIEALIQDCWHNSPAKRPSMKQASEILCSVMEQCTKDESIHVRHKDLLGESTRSLIDSLGIIEFNPDDA
jgi:serine/threonine protein kinase